MSHKATNAVYDHSRAKLAARLVLLALADIADDEGYVRAYKRSQAALARKQLLGEATVRKAIDSLEELGELVVLKHGDGRVQSDYRIVLPGLGAQIEGAQIEHPGAQDRAPSPADLSTQGDQIDAPIMSLLDGSSPSSSPSGGAKRRAAPKQAIAGDFAVTEGMRVWAARECPSIDVDAETAKFVDHWLGKGERRADWVASWRVWMRNAVDFSRSRTPASRAPVASGADRLAASGRLTDL